MLSFTEGSVRIHTVWHFHTMQSFWRSTIFMISQRNSCSSCYCRMILICFLRYVLAVCTWRQLWRLSCSSVENMWTSSSFMIPFRYAHITTRATVSTAHVNSPPRAQSSMSASIFSRVTANLALRAKDSMASMDMRWSSSEDSVVRILKTFTRSTETNVSSWVNRRGRVLVSLVKQIL